MSYVRGEITMKFTAISLILLSSVNFISCGSRINPVVKLNRPIAGEEFVDLDAIQLLKLQDGTSVNIGQYMRDQKLPWLVLSFGSQGCGICMEKARYLQTNLINTEYASLGLLPEPQNKVEVIGVFTDPISSRDELLGLVSGTELPLTIMSWMDPSHNVMMKYFQAAGRSFSVPLTVMLSPRGILWRVNSNDKISAEDLIKKIANTIASDAHPTPPTPPPSPPTPPPVQISLLGSEVPERLNGSVVTSCGDRSQSLLGSVMPPVAGGLRAVLVHKDACLSNAACVEAREALMAWQTECGLTRGVVCSFKEVAVDAGQCLKDPNLLTGGLEFYETFADHFNWGYTRENDGPGRYKLPEVRGPLTLIFDGAGRLVFSKEGVIGQSLSQRMIHDQLQDRAEGPDFSVAWNQFPIKYPSANNLATFSKVRSQSKYTLVMFMNMMCSSCLEEIGDWHAEQDSPYHLCLANPSFCQVTAIETMPDGALPLVHLSNVILNPDSMYEFGWVSKGWSMPVSVEGDQLTNGQAPNGWFNGWFKAKFGSSEPRVVLFDREGKVVSSWKSLPSEHGARDTMQKLFNEERGMSAQGNSQEVGQGIGQ
jgi:hypothetical protein